MNRTLSLATFSALALLSTHALADSSPDATTDVRVTSDWANTEVIRHLGTSYGSGSVGGRSATITTIHLERLCRTPCTTALATEGTYYVDAPGMHAREFRLPPESKNLKVRVAGASSTPLVLSGWATLLGGTAALTGGLMWGVFASVGTGQDTSAFQTITLVGGGVMVAGILGLVFFPRTHVEADGVVLDARAGAPPATARGARFTGNGFVF